MNDLTPEPETPEPLETGMSTPFLGCAGNLLGVAGAALGGINLILAASRNKSVWPGAAVLAGALVLMALCNVVEATRRQVKAIRLENARLRLEQEKTTALLQQQRQWLQAIAGKLDALPPPDGNPPSAPSEDVRDS